MKDRIQLFATCLNLALLGLLAAVNYQQDVRYNEQDRTMRLSLGALPETVEVFCRKPACRCRLEPGGCACCRCGESNESR